MYIALTVVHVLVCFFLIAVILLQAGRGGGLSDMAGGGGQPQAILGTQTNTFMMRVTEVCAILFIVTSISLGLLTASRNKSLVEKTRLSRAVKGAVAAATAPKAQSVEPAPVTATTGTATPSSSAGSSPEAKTAS